MSDGVASITPFIYSMIMWANVDDQPGEPFVNALWTFLVRMGLVAGWIPTIGTRDDRPAPRPALGDGRRHARPSTSTRWSG